METELVEAKKALEKMQTSKTGEIQQKIMTAVVYILSQQVCLY